jgi:pimeloyl-ACP methyl ester carboxylesterase
VSTIDRFIEIPDVGHCPQDEAPAQVNLVLKDWISDLQISSPVRYPAG